VFVECQILVTCASLLVIGDQTLNPGNIRRPCVEDLTPITSHGAQLELDDGPLCLENLTPITNQSQQTCFGYRI